MHVRMRLSLAPRLLELGADDFGFRMPTKIRARAHRERAGRGGSQRGEDDLFVIGDRAAQAA